jgi:hypothetical protein
VLHRYLPVTAALGVLCLVAAFAPTLAPDRVEVAVDQGAELGPSEDLADGAPAAPGADPTAAPGTPGAPGGARSGSGRVELGATPSAGGTSRGGVECAPGAQQVTWSAYAPPCRAAFTGDNGGATAHGVTGSTIRITYRKSDSTQDGAAFAALGSPNFSDTKYVADLQAYVDLFNREYELYGRKVELVAFQGRGDWLSEHQGQNLAAAQADAATAHDLGAFADVSLFYKATEAYHQYLARSGVLAIGAAGLPQEFFERNAPWAWSPFPTGDKLAGWAVNTACQHLNGLEASFAGDEALRATKRALAIITPDTPGYTASGVLMEQGLERCGTPVVRRIAYSFNIPTIQTQANNIIAQLRAAGATTVICYCDPVMPAFLTQTAEQQQFRPEWMAATVGPTDQLLRYSDADQWAHAISNQGAFPSQSESEAYRVLRRAGAEPAEEFYPTAYALVLELFNGLQAAGPNLTPATFQLGMFSLPPSGPGEFGSWAYGTGAYTPGTDTQLGWWSNAATSAFDGQRGGWQDCRGGQWFPYAYERRHEWGPPGTPLGCFG